MTIIESARALLVDPQDCVLLMKLAFNAHRTYWLTPGGSLHPGESFEDALRREIREETGLTILRGACVADTYHPSRWIGFRMTAQIDSTHLPSEPTPDRVLLN
jgi:8-oxo-dGTP diphosphatase